MADLEAVVVDPGTDTTRVGISNGEKQNPTTVETIIGVPQDEHSDQDGIYGDEVNSFRGQLKIERLMKNGSITGWNHIDTFWSYCFEEKLKIECRDRNFLVTRGTEGTHNEVEQTAEVVFEKLQAHGLYMTRTAPIALYATGRTTGLILDCGYSGSRASPIYEGYYVQSAFTSSKIGGHTVTQYMATLLNKNNGLELHYRTELEAVRLLKERVGYIVKTPGELDSQDSWRLSKNFELPDGQVITPDEERYRAPEILFRPEVGEQPDLGVHRLIQNSISNCDMDIVSNMYANIVLTGGTTMFTGFAERLRSHLGEIFAKPVIVVETPERRYGSYIGAMVLSSLSSFRNMVVTVEEYTEFGCNALTRLNE